MGGSPVATQPHGLCSSPGQRQQLPWHRHLAALVTVQHLAQVIVRKDYVSFTEEIAPSACQNYGHSSTCQAHSLAEPDPDRYIFLVKVIQVLNSLLNTTFFFWEERKEREKDT